ncbi:MAG TPA: SRPBCC family protein [Dehalococcoidia bacterium]|nr:SRPBCC family protein [Dehalococcoidia bacterium]
MLRHSATILIAAAPQRVFAYLADVSRHPEWAGDELRIEPLDDGPVRLDWRFRSVGRQLGARADLNVVSEFDPPWGLAFEVDGNEGRFRNSFVLEEANAGTRLTKTFESLETRGLARLAQLVYPLIAAPTMRRDLKRIKERLERSSAE